MLNNLIAHIASIFYHGIMLSLILLFSDASFEYAVILLLLVRAVFADAEKYEAWLNKKDKTNGKS